MTNRRGRAALRVLVADMTGGARAAAGLERWLTRVAPSRARGTLTVALMSDARIRALNRRYRGVNRATDVLSFAMADESRHGGGGSVSRAGRRRGERLASGDGALSPAGAVWLGDVVIAMGVARRQARQARHSLRTELRVLALHGLLHLLGYDHGRDAGQMARLERRLRRRGGLPVGLIERAS